MGRNAHQRFNKSLCYSFVTYRTCILGWVPDRQEPRADEMREPQRDGRQAAQIGRVPVHLGEHHDLVEELLLHGTLRCLGDDLERRFLGLGLQRLANPVLVIELHLALDGNAVGVLLGVDRAVVVAAEKNEVGRLIAVFGCQSLAATGP